MTPENIRLNIQEQWARAMLAKGAADLLADNGYLSDAVSRLYYFLFHVVQALLLTRELEPRSHEGTLRLFSLQFVKNGPLSPDAAHIFSRLMKYRLEADYAASYTFTPEDYSLFRKEAETVAGTVEDHLRLDRWL